jgi:hypothetical protein
MLPCFSECFETRAYEGGEEPEIDAGPCKDKRMLWAIEVLPAI